MRTNGKTKIIGIWDDHDYGKNDGGIHLPIKHEQKQLFLDFLEEPKYSQRRRRGPDHGIYEHYQAKIRDDFSIRIVLLDIRYEFDKWGAKK